MNENDPNGYKLIDPSSMASFYQPILNDITEFSSLLQAREIPSCRKSSFPVSLEPPYLVSSPFPRRWEMRCDIMTMLSTSAGHERFHALQLGPRRRNPPGFEGDV